MAEKELKTMDVNYDAQAFDELEANPYEVVIALAKEARSVNERAQKYFGLEHRIKPINLALKKLENDDVHFEYLSENKEKKVEENEESSGI